MMASKKKDWTELLGTGDGASDAVIEAHPAEPPTTVLMHTIVGNPENPRSEADYTDADPEFAELKASMREAGQLQPLAVVARAAYERVKPGHTKALGDAEWVTVTGNRRLAAARQLGWTRIDIRVQERLGDDEHRIDEAVIIENIHRKNIAPVKEAEFLRRMVERHGSQEKVAERIGKSQMYVSHRLSLLKLAPDIQEKVETGQLKLKEARQLASRTSDHAEQRARLAEAQAAPKPAVQRATEAPVQNPVLKSPAAPAEPVPLSTPPAQAQKDHSEQAVAEETPSATVAVAAPAAVPEPRPELEQPARPTKMPWDNPAECARIIGDRMKPAERQQLVGLLLEQERIDVRLGYVEPRPS